MRDPKQTRVVACVQHRFAHWNFPAGLAEDLRRRYPGLTVVHLPDYSGLADAIADAHIYIGFSLRRHQFARARKLQWIHSTAAGVHQLMRDDIRRSPVLVTNARTVLTVPMAEHTLALILALARRLPSAVRYQAQKRWAQSEIWEEEPRPREVSGATLLIVGYGAIGRELGRRAQALDMHVIGVKRDITRGREHAEEIIPPDRLSAVLHRADFVVLATPVTTETEHLFGRPQFATMKNTAFLVNIGRGALVDTAALMNALEDRKIGGAALDVAEEEPLPPGHPLWSAPNLLVTPHIAAVSDRLWDRQKQLLFENLDRWFRGAPLLNLVDKERGY